MKFEQEDAWLAALKRKQAIQGSKGALVDQPQDSNPVVIAARRIS